MNTNLMKRALPLTITTIVMTIALTAGAQAATPPVKLVLASHFGSEVNQTTKDNLCTVASHDVCQPGKESSEPGGFAFPGSVAVQTDPTSPGSGDVYVVDTANERVQELTPSGEFVLMFGREVNETTKGDLCTAQEVKASGVKCEAGAPGANAGAFQSIQSVVVDPSTGNVYIEDYENQRVDEYSADGEFLLMIGRDVNKKGGDLCTKAESSECQSGEKSSPGGSEPSAFSFETRSAHDVLAVGGPEDLLYVGDQQRVQEFKASGSPAGEIALPSGGHVGALAVNAGGDVFLAYEGGASVSELDPTGQQLTVLPIASSDPLPRAPGEPEASVEVGTLALDYTGHLAVTAVEHIGSSRWFGVLYDAATGRPITEFSGWGPTGMGFGAGGELYAAASINTVSGTGNEVLAYEPLPVGELFTGAATCQAGMERETDATFDCGLIGEVDAWGVKETEVSFEWGGTESLGQATAPPSSIANMKSTGEEEPLAQVSAPLVGLLPNATYYYEPVGYDENVKPPEKALSGDRASFTTPAVPPRIVGEPSASFVGSSSAVLFGELNPENANTEYLFEYGACPTLAECADTQIGRTTANRSSAYETIGTTLEAGGLQPATVYSYRLFAQSENAAKTEQLKATGSEGTFTTAPAPVPRASTGAPSAVTSTTAVVSGAATPDGQPATYAFELGVYNGASTRYGIVFSGSAGASVGSVPESLALSGLQPGTTYAYRIVVKSGYGVAIGKAVLFTTAGLPAVLVSPSPLAMLTVPSIAFPATVTPPKPKLATKQTKKKKTKKTKGRKSKRAAARKSTAHRRKAHKVTG